MIKELLLAITIGATLGLGITGGYLTLSQKNQNQKQTIVSKPTTIPTPTIYSLTENNEIIDSLTIISPEDNLLVSKATINISGKTTNSSQIVINTPTESFIGQSNQEGLFDIPIELETGLNIIKISSIDTDGNQVDKEINITYSTAKI